MRMSRFFCRAVILLGMHISSSVLVCSMLEEVMNEDVDMYLQNVQSIKSQMHTMQWDLLYGKEAEIQKDCSLQIVDEAQKALLAHKGQELSEKSKEILSQAKRWVSKIQETPEWKKIELGRWPNELEMHDIMERLLMPHLLRYYAECMTGESAQEKSLMELASMKETLRKALIEGDERVKEKAVNCEASLMISPWMQMGLLYASTHKNDSSKAALDDQV